MKRFLTTTALALTMGVSAWANTDMQTDWSAPVEATEGQFYGSDLIGMRIYRSETEYQTGDEYQSGELQEWDDVGEINDLIISQSGEVDAVILGIGGFLGLGERDVAIKMDAIRIVHEAGDPDDRFLVVNASKEELGLVPEYRRDAGEVAEETQAEVETEGVNAVEEAEAALEHAAQETETAAENAAAETDAAVENATEETAQAAENAAQEVEETAENAAQETEAAVETAAAEVEAEVAEAEQAAEETQREVAEAAGEEPVIFNRPEEQREGYAEVEMVEATSMSTEELEGARVYGVNDEDLGEISALIAENGELTKAVIDVGGFLGMGEKPVAVQFASLQILKNAETGNLRVYLDATEEGLEAQPEYKG